MTLLNSNIVSVDWLEQHINHPNLIVLDATVKKQPTGDPVPRSNEYIPGTREFDFDTKICDQKTSLPHMLCSSHEFESHVQALGINKNHSIVIYDAMGIFSSPRAWWMFKVMGHDQVAILDGGLPEWLKQNKSIESTMLSSFEKGNFISHFRPELVTSRQQMLDYLDDTKIQITDARSYERFSGEVAEPRAGLAKGHIPGSVCLPYTELLSGNCYKSSDELEKIFNSVLPDNNQHYVFSCGSGVTACILALAAVEVGYLNWGIYDGSWSEWGANPELPVATK